MSANLLQTGHPTANQASTPAAVPTRALRCSVLAPSPGSAADSATAPRAVTPDSGRTYVAMSMPIRIEVTIHTGEFHATGGRGRATVGVGMSTVARPTINPRAT